MVFLGVTLFFESGCLLGGIVIVIVDCGSVFAWVHLLKIDA